MMRSTELWLMSRSCQSATFSSAAIGVAAQHACQAGQAFAGDGIALVRHRAGTFLSVGEKFFRFQNFGALQMAKFRRPTFDARADQRQGGDKLGVQIALNHLRRDRRGAQPQFLADICFDLRAKDARWCRPRRKACRPPRLFRPLPTVATRGQIRHASKPFSAQRWSARHGCRGCGRSSA